MIDDLSDLKPGDEVAMRNRFGGPWRIFLVESRSPSGRLTADKKVFNPNGRLRGGRSWERCQLRRVEECDREHMLSDALREVLRENFSISLRRLPYAALKQIDKIFETGNALSATDL
jgi:hypothetical protein